MPVKKLKTTIQKSKVNKSVRQLKDKKVLVKGKKVQKVVKTQKVELALKTNEPKSSLKITVLNTEGKSSGTMTLSQEVFGAKVNPKLMAQAVRVYLANQRQGNASTKTRGEIAMTTAKWYRQKGTGRARHGAKSAPIFVKGGVAHGPKPKDFSMTLPSKMKRGALFSALTSQFKNGNVVVVSGLEKLELKTKTMAIALEKLGRTKKTLLIMPELIENIYKSGRNIKGVMLTPASQLSTFSVLGAGKIIFMKEAVEKI